MESFDIDIGHGRTICIEATKEGVDFNSYAYIPSGKQVKVTSKSIHLDINAWKKFNDNIDVICANFNDIVENPNSRVEFTLHLGKLIYVRAVSTINCIHIRTYFFDCKDKVIKPGRPGLAFKISEFKELLNCIDSINRITEIDSVESCCTLETQSDCKICNN
jgi:hypothetical protein